MSETKTTRRLGAFVGAAAILLLAACNNQLPAPPPVPGQPMTWAQKHQLYLQEYQQLNQDRMGN